MNKILLFIPMYNCEKQIVRVLKQLNENVCSYLSEVIIVNNRSTDEGEKAVMDYVSENTFSIPLSILRNDENYGLGGSHKVAFDYAVKNKFDYVIVLHGDDQGQVKDFLPLLESQQYKKYDCCLGTRFMKGSKLIGYSKIRILGNYAFNMLFSMVVHKKINDLGSGLNMYKVETLKTFDYKKYPDTLYFNNLMILASCYYKHNLLFYPISWREEDQVSNNKLWKFSCALLKMLYKYKKNKKQYLENDMREKKIENYTAQVVWEN